jgi:hypothetical protein
MSFGATVLVPDSIGTLKVTPDTAPDGTVCVDAIVAPVSTNVTVELLTNDPI